jgi:two-component system CheB/CheR fusion protein
VVRDITDRRRLEQEILRISDQERRRIGQDLHDGLGQMLTGTALIARNLTQKLRSAGVPEADDLAEITDLIKEADEYARGLAKGLVPVELEENGLSAALRQLISHVERLFPVRCTFNSVGTLWNLESTVSTHLYRIAQEALSNAVKHGRARKVSLTLSSGSRQLRLRIKDDGIGFPDELPEEHGMGVQIMHYRARIIGATLEIWRDPAGGTVVICSLPFKVAAVSSVLRNENVI